MKTTADEQGKLTNTGTAAGVAEVQAPFEVVDMGPFDNNRNDVRAVNDSGQAAGVSLNSTTGRIEAFVQEDGKRSPLGTLGGSFSIANGINNRGEVVGGSHAKESHGSYCLPLSGSRLYDLNSLMEPSAGWEIIQAISINNRGEILGIGCQDGRDRIVLLRPKS